VLLVAIDRRSLASARLWAALLAAEQRSHAWLRAAIAVCATLGGAYATLRQRQQARMCAMQLLSLAQRSGDRALAHRARLYVLLATDTRHAQAHRALMRRVQVVRDTVQAEQRPELVGLADYVLSQRAQQ